MGRNNRNSRINDTGVGDHLAQQKKRSPLSRFTWATVCISAFLFSFICIGSNMDNRSQHRDGQNVGAFSGGKTNLHKRFRPNQGKAFPVDSYAEVNDRAKWMIRTVMITLQQDVYLFGSWMNENWWAASDLDLCIETKPTETQLRQMELLSKQFAVTIELRKCGPGPRIKCEEEY